MIPEQQCFLTCLKDLCANRQTLLPASIIDEELFFQLSDEQDLSGIVYAQCRDWLGQNKKFKNALVNNIAVAANRKYLLQEIAVRFQKENISFICMKGSVFRDWWPVPELRSMGDVDIIIHTEDRQKSDKIMSDLGYKRLIDNHAVWTYWLSAFMVEIHDHMFYEHLANRIDYQGFYDCVWEHAKIGQVFDLSFPNMYVPDDNLHFLYLMTHTAKHIINKGIGFRAFLDMVFYSRNPELDWDYISKELKKLQLLEFTETCFAFCEYWFDVKIPFSHRALSSEFIDKVTNKIFEDGMFGLENQENKEANSAKEVKRSKMPYWVTSVQLIIHRLFPPYRDVQLIPWYVWVDGRPWLLPAVWVYRWCYCLIHKRKSSIDLLTEMITRKKKIEKREEFIETWGL